MRSDSSDGVGSSSAPRRRGNPAAHALLPALLVLAGCGDTAVPAAGLGPVPLGSLTVGVAGLPAGAPAAITVSSPQGYRRDVTGPEVLSDLVPGTYLVTASPVTVDRDRYDAAPAAQSIVVAAGAPGLRVVSYAVATGRIQLTLPGVPSSTAGAITVRAQAESPPALPP